MWCKLKINSLHCFMIDLYGILCLVSLVSCPRTLDEYLFTSIGGFGKMKEAKSLWRCAVYAIVWCIWLECNSLIFNDRYLDKLVLWDKIICLASIWCKAHNLFIGIFRSDILRDWKAWLHYFFLVYFLLLVLVFIRKISCSPSSLYSSSLLSY